MLGVTIALASTGAITFQTAATLVLGENIGNTIIALLASIPANTEAKRTARAHAFFNVIGVSVMIPLRHPPLWSSVGVIKRHITPITSF